MLQRTLLNVTYKILAKTLALRDQKVAANIFQLEQTNFIQDKFNLDTICTAWESMELDRETGHETLLLKIDSSVSYNRLD